MNIYKIEDLEQIQAEQNYKYCGLFSETGQQIVPFNSNRIPAADRLSQICIRLRSNGLKNGFYIVKCKNSLKGNVEPDQYIIQKGENLSEPAPKEIIKEITVTPEILTYQSALKLQVDNERLKLQIQNLEQTILTLEAELSEKETLSEEAEPSAAQTWIENIIQIGAPLLDKHFALRQQAMQIKAAEIAQRQQLANMRRGNVGKHVAQKRSIEDTILTFQDDPDTYNTLMDIYQNATSEEEFLKDLKDYDLEIYTSVTNGK
jgi:hypothetical protein